ncbi:ElyC/SanA/YdcF family protein [Ferrimonas senticii]|uniref:ElyC/SanA/YdcF family protein n=1 Tax=Ferrimonas senticii TaxID=394566 RepID=UPI000428E199|nr:ElyC/SanA/YdcF family protein [Ferrimonas senticii]
MLGFWLKKGISALLLPLPSALLLMALGWLLMRRWRRLGQALLLLGPVYLTLLSFSPVTVWLANSLEQRYPVYQGQRVEFVAVLGSGHHSDPERPIEQQLSAVARGRLLEGLRLLQINPQATLIVSGYSGEDGRPHAEVMHEAARRFGVPAQRIVYFPKAKDTQEEAAATLALVGDRPLALVTSATHMHRSMLSYRLAGLTPIAAPADFIATPTRSWYLSAQNLWTSQRVLHEYIGLLWLAIKG